MITQKLHAAQTIAQKLLGGPAPGPQVTYSVPHSTGIENVVLNKLPGPAPGPQEASPEEEGLQLAP
jgi:hypothetical protein